MSRKKATDPDKALKKKQPHGPTIPGTYQVEPVGEMYHDPGVVVNNPERSITQFTDEELSVMKKDDALVEIHGAIPCSSPDNPIIRVGADDLVKEIPRYFICGVFNFFDNGYHSIVIAGIRRLEPQDLDNIQDTVVRMFEKEIQEAREEDDRGEWSGLPDKYTFMLQQINRL